MFLNELMELPDSRIRLLDFARPLGISRMATAGVVHLASHRTCAVGFAGWWTQCEPRSRGLARFFLVCASRCCSHVTHASFARKDASAGARHPRACVHVRTRTSDSERKCTGMRYLRGTFVPRLVLFVPRSSCLLRPCLMHESCTRRTTMTTTTVTSHTCAIGPVAGVSRSRFRDVDISHFRWKGI